MKNDDIFEFVFFLGEEGKLLRKRIFEIVGLKKTDI